jgi:acyl-CoA synthetase (AMP-forming)/AMP-acid ligase II
MRSGGAAAMNVAQMLDWAADRYGDRVAFDQGGHELSYAELDERASRFANALAGLGVQKGDRVAIVVGNLTEYVEVEFGVTKLGAVRTPILIRSSAEDIGYMLGISDAVAVIVSTEALTLVREAVKQVAQPVEVIVIGEKPQAGEHAYEDLLAAAASTRLAVDLTADDLYALRFTGGTTGRPKGVLMSQRMMSVVISNMLINWPIEHDDVVVHFHPLSHAAGMIMYPWHMRGARQVIMPAFNFKPEALLRTIERERATAMFMIPTVLNVVLDADLVGEFDVSSLRTIVYGGAPPPLKRIRQALASLGPVLVQLYGTSEAPNILTTLQREEHLFEGEEPPRRLASAGRVGFGVEVRVVDEDGIPCQPGEVGEIVSRGDHTMVGYWKDPELTAERVVDGWVYTRDMGTFDEDGYLYIVDRKDDMIISGGFNIWPAEVEDVLYGHEAILEAAAFGVQDDKWGEVVVAAVCCRDEHAVSEDELQAYVRDHAARHKVPKRVWLRSSGIPKSPAGKPLRREVRDEFLRAYADATEARS